jgi:hypothetical protein
MKQTTPSADRNMHAIRDAMRDLVPVAACDLLEIASGTGQHGALIAPALPNLKWWPCEHDPARMASIAAYAAETENMMGAQQVDVMQAGWAEAIRPELVDVMLNINMIHISPWEACCGLLEGARIKLKPGGILMFYGPFRQRDVETVQSNREFDEWLKQRDPSYGLRLLEDVADEASARGLQLEKVLTMPANNLLVVFTRQGA